MSQNYGSTNLPSNINHPTQTTEDKKEVSNFRRALPQFCVVGVKNLILLGWGLILGYPTILIPGLQYKGENSTEQPDFILDDNEISWIGSINLLCVPLGSITSGLLMDSIGKRRMMQLLNLPMLAAWALFFFAKDITQVYLGLCLSGMSGGLLEAPLLIYIAETVQPQYRGMLTASGTATVLGGVCLQFIIGSMLHWRTVAAISAIVPFLAFNAVFLVPESPYWLYSKKRVEDAQNSLKWLRGWVSFKAIENEFQSVVNSVEDLQAHKKSNTIERITAGNKLKPFGKRTFILPFLLILAGFIFSHFSGMTPMQTYSIQILGSYRVPINEYYATILLGAAQVIGCLIGMAFVRSIGKRGLVFLSFIGCGVCFFAVATQSHLREGSYQVDFKTNTNPINSSINNLEQNVLGAIVKLRNRIDREATDEAIRITNENGTIPEFLEIGDQKVNTTAFRHIDPHILREVLKLALHEVNYRNFTEMDQQKLKEFFEKTGLLIDSNNVKRQNSSQLTNMTGVQIDTDKLIELLNISKNIIFPFMRNEDSRQATSRIVEKIEQNIRNVLTSNDTIKETQLATDINELATTLSTFGRNITVGKVVDEEQHDDTEGNYRWIPMILLLCGSMFAHCGAKLFPWMLIGEIYPMDVRSPAAGLSSAVGYLVGFFSNKLFLSMVAAFTLNGTFWFYSAVSGVGVIIMFFTLPETEGRSIEELQMLYVKKKDIQLRLPNIGLKREGTNSSQTRVNA